MYKLRPYQQQAVKDAIDFINSPTKRSGIIVQPTGAGKSLIVANIAKRLKQPLLVIQPSKELLIQNLKKYESYGETATVFSASVGSKELSEVTFATPMSIIKHPEKVKQYGIKTLIVDECHYGSGKGQKLDEFCKKVGITKIIGLTATPVILANGMFGSELRMMNRTKKSFYQNIIHVTQISELTEKGFWSRLEYDARKTDTKPLRMNSSRSEFLEESVRDYYTVNRITEMSQEACDELLEEGRNHILCFTSLVDEAQRLHELMPDRSVVVWGDMPKSEREEAIRKFTQGEVPIAINVNVLGTGFDFPEIDGCVHARPTGSIGLYYQHLGRCVRVSDKKQSAKIVDISGNFFRFGKLENITFSEDREANGWCMKSKGKILTAYSKPDITVDYKPKLKKKQIETKHFLIPFGKHKDKKLSEVPLTYLQWVSSDKFEAHFQSAYDFKTAAKLYVEEQAAKNQTSAF